MSQREEFVRLVHQRRHPITELCVAFGISEKTGHKWLSRFHEQGIFGLADRSHAPHLAAHQISPKVRRQITRLRSEHPTWGARKLRVVLARSSPEITWPAPSTIGELLRREGLIHRTRRTRYAKTRAGAPLDSGLTLATAPNDVWTTDFKGEFRLSPGPYCYPLTVLDAQSRYLLGCTALLSTATVPVKVVFTRLFESFGLPAVIRSDNGVPFANSLSLGRLSTLSVWWIRLGIRPERITPGHPQQNGQHERMHKTLKAEATRPASASLRAQQARFDRFRREYNSLRPHEALGQREPASLYKSSPRSFPKQLLPIEYLAHLEVRSVGGNGMVTWQGRKFWLTKALSGENVSLEETDEETWTVNFGPLTLGTYHPPSNIFLPETCWKTDASED
ncbi:MAG: integrase core domain-containing protein [Gemmatimonadaceae bacterium]